MKILFFSGLLVFSLLLAGCGINNQPSTVNVSTETDTEISEPLATTTLDLSTQNLSKVPPEIFNRTELESLDLSYNKLSGAIPAEIRHLKNLKILKLDHNQMTGVPAEIGQLSNLVNLDLSNNKLTGLPQELANLSKLQYLNLSGNDYSKQDLKYIQDRLPNTTFILK